MRAIVLACVMAAGCTAAAPEPTPDEPALELGTGTARFEPVVDGDELPMIRGAQGGWHVWASVRVTGMDVDVGSLRFEHQPADESEPPVELAVGAHFDPADATGGRSALGYAMIFSDPTCSVGRLHRIRVTLTTPSGETLSAERDVMPTGGEFPPPPCGTELPLAD